jgi:hypothetical protein
MRVRVGDMALLVVAARGARISTLALGIHGIATGGISRGAVSAHDESLDGIVRPGRAARAIVFQPPAAFAGGVCFAKLDARRERRTGLFDPWSWIRLSVPEDVATPVRPRRLAGLARRPVARIAITP